MKKKYYFLRVVFLFCFLFFHGLILAQKDVYLIIGERNAQGRAEIEAEDEIALTEVSLYNGTTWEDAKNDSALAPDGGLNRYSSIGKASNDQKLNFAYAFGKMVNEVTSNEIGLVVSARAGADILQWEKGGSGSGWYEDTIDDLNDALALEVGSTVKGILWCHGEADRNNSGYISDVTDFDLTTLISNFRTDLGIADLPFIACEISKQRTDNATFNTNIKTITDSGDANYIADTDYISSEGLQTISGSDQDYNSNSQRVLGYRYAAKILEMAYGYTYVENHIMYVTEDVFVRGGADSAIPQEPVDDQRIRIKNPNSGTNTLRKGLLKFDVSTLTGTEDRIVVDATLKIDVRTIDGDMDISIYDMDTSWSEDTVAFDDVAFTTPISKSATNFYLDTGVLIHNGADLTEFLKDEYVLETSTIALGLESDNADGNDLEITPKDHLTDSALKPYIVVSYLESPVVTDPQTTKLAKLTFETSPTDTDPAITDISYTTSIVEYSDIGVGDAEDFFTRTKDGDQTGTEVSTTYSYTDPVDLGDYFFVASDIDDGATYTVPVYLDLEEIDISNYENLEIRIYLASINGELNSTATADAAWDNNPSGAGNNNDYVHFKYDVDNTGSYTDLLWVESQATDGTINEEPKIDTNFDGTGNGASILDTFTQFKATIPTTGSTLDIQIEFKMDNHGEDLAIDNIEIWGTLANSTCSGTNVTWNGSVWSNGTGPDISTPVVINGDYSALDDEGSFSACSLTVNSSFTLTIEEDFYVEIEHDATIDGDLILENNAAFIQNDDTGTFTIGGSGETKFTKTTDVLENWYDYTYWSSPVSGLTIGTSPLVSTNRRFWHNANNYLDEYTEINNTDTFEVIASSDDIDDNGDDWQTATNSTAMTPGVGFIASHVKSGFVSGTSYDYEFSGPFNNGEISVPVSYNALNLGGHWNLLGNPYPSALDFDAFVSNNPGVIEGIALLWSQATDPSPTASGNEQINFSDADYIIMNTGSGSVNNSPGTLLEYIPSGQSFFTVSLSNGNATFNNSMRIKNGDSNSQFFKTSNSKNAAALKPNKLWINLTSDSGSFNQVLIAYVDGATNNFDGLSFDAIRNVNSLPSIIYTLIEDKSDKKFAIQGKNTTSINEDEVIDLGFFTTETTPTIYTLSIDHLQGDFISSNTIYIKDNLLDTIHNLSTSDYLFTSEAGEFNDRFEIAFSTNALSTNNSEITNNELQVINLDNDRITFKASKDLTIKNVTIYDLSGRKIFNFKGVNNSETYSTSSLSNATYIAVVELSNKSIVNKKIIKL